MNEPRLRESSQQTRALIELREKILSGAIQPGTRLTEIPLAESLGVSRTPIRLALAQLEQEGLVVPLPSSGFVVRQFTFHEIADAIKVRGVLEGLAARLLAERGLTRRLAQEFATCLDEGDLILADDSMSYEQFQKYVELNVTFHRLVVEGAGNHALKRALQLNDKMPFAAADALVSGQASVPTAQKILLFAHAQHRRLVEALEAGEGVNAQSIAEQHAHGAIRNLREALELSRKPKQSIPGLSLIELNASSVEPVRRYAGE